MQSLLEWLKNAEEKAEGLTIIPKNRTGLDIHLQELKVLMNHITLPYQLP